MKTIHLGVIRCVDTGAALVGGLLLLPVVVLLGLLVRLDSSGPALFRQERVGLSERRFTCLKLRTMSMGTPVAGTHEVQAAAVTPLGRRLRHLKLDELPQLWNVFRGDMSLVGPRPCLPTQVELIEARRERGVFRVRPGVTGPAQVQGLDMSTPVALAEEDSIWAARPTVPQYLRLILQTLGGRGQGDRIRAG